MGKTVVSVDKEQVGDVNTSDLIFVSECLNTVSIYTRHCQERPSHHSFIVVEVCLAAEANDGKRLTRFTRLNFDFKPTTSGVHSIVRHDHRQLLRKGAPGTLNV